MNGRKSKDGPASSAPGGQRASRPQSAARRSSLPREPAPRVPSSGSAIARLRLGALSRRRGERWKWWWQLELECWSSGKAAASAPPGRLRAGWLGERRGGDLRAPLHVRGAAPRAWRRRAEGRAGVHSPTAASSSPCPSRPWSQVSELEGNWRKIRVTMLCNRWRN